MKYSKSVIIKDTIGIVIALLLITTLALSTGCGAGGANIRLQGVTLGTVTMDEKPVQGLPSDKIDLLLDASRRWTEKEALDYLSDQHALLDKTTVLISANKRWGLTKLLELISHTLTQIASPV